MARPLRLRRPADDEDRGSIIMALLLILVGTMLAGLLVPLVILQANSSGVDTRREHSLDAAQTGIDMVIGRIRAANDGTSANNGSLSKLPCLPLAGQVSTGGTARYQTTVYYFAQNPHGHPEWLNDPSKQLSCLNGRGVIKTPAYAVIVSIGTDSATGSLDSVPTRTMQATYVFETRDTNVQGGLIHSSDSTPDLCLDAGSSSPTQGAIVTFQTCNSGLNQQSWSFNQNLTVSLVSSSTSSANLGLCLDAGSLASGTTITLQNCASTTIQGQQWSYNGNRNFVATNPGGTQASVCWNAQSPNTVSAALILGGCTAAAGQSFIPDAAVGAGNAGTGQQMLVNFNQFGRCLDVTNQTLPSASGVSFLISYPCKVSPDGTQAPVNQQWNIPAITGTSTSASGIITSVQNTSYCLISRGTVGSNPYMDLCSTAPPSTSTTWTFTGQTGNYTTSYRISDSAGHCLQVTDPSLSPPDLFVSNGSFSKIITAACSSSTLQKWNAPPDVQTAPVQDYQEK